MRRSVVLGVELKAVATGQDETGEEEGEGSAHDQVSDSGVHKVRCVGESISTCEMKESACFRRQWERRLTDDDSVPGGRPARRRCGGGSGRSGHLHAKGSRVGVGRSLPVAGGRRLPSRSGVGRGVVAVLGSSCRENREKGKES